MARKAAQKKEVNNDGKELFEALKLLEAEKGIPVDFMIDKIKKAIATACKNSYGNEDVVIDMDPESGKFDVFLRKEIVEERNSIKESIKQQQENFKKELKEKNRKKDFLCPERDFC